MAFILNSNSHSRTLSLWNALWNRRTAKLQSNDWHYCAHGNFGALSHSHCCYLFSWHLALLLVQLMQMSSVPCFTSGFPLLTQLQKPKCFISSKTKMRDSQCRRLATLFHINSYPRVTSKPLKPRIWTLMAEVKIHSSDWNADNLWLRPPNCLNIWMKDILKLLFYRNKN